MVDLIEQYLRLAAECEEQAKAVPAGKPQQELFRQATSWRKAAELRERAMSSPKKPTAEIDSTQST